MNRTQKVKGKPALVNWYGRVFIVIGMLITFLGFFASVIDFFVDNILLLKIVLFLETIWGAGVFLAAYGLAVKRGRRWHIFGLLLFIFFGSVVAGLLSMVGRETTVGYYIWAVGGIISLSLIVILIAYWETLLDG